MPIKSGGKGMGGKSAARPAAKSVSRPVAKAPSPRPAKSVSSSASSVASKSFSSASKSVSSTSKSISSQARSFSSAPKSSSGVFSKANTKSVSAPGSVSSAKVPGSSGASSGGGLFGGLFGHNNNSISKNEAKSLQAQARPLSQASKHQPVQPTNSMNKTLGTAGAAGVVGGLVGNKIGKTAASRNASERTAPVIPRPNISMARPGTPEYNDYINPSYNQPGYNRGASAASVAGGILASGVSSFVNNFASEAGSSMGASYADVVNQKNENLMTDLRLEEEAKMNEADRERRIQEALLNLPCECSHCGAPPSGESLYCEYCDCKLIEEVYTE